MKAHKTSALLAALLIGAATLPSRAAEKAIFTLTDPRGDDHGDGTIVYPRRDDLTPGELDLLSLEAREENDGTRFVATFARYVRPTGHRTIDIGGGNLDDYARHGFYTFNLDIYIDTDRKPGSGHLALLPGRKAEADPAHAWEKAICLTPRPGVATGDLIRILSGFAKRDLKASKGQVDSADLDAIKAQVRADVERNVFFPTLISVTGPAISFFVPGSFLGGPAKPEWSYIVVVTGASIDRRIDISGALGVSDREPDNLMVVPVEPGMHTDRFGTTREDPLQPPIIDLIAPPGTTQEEILRNDDPKSGRPVRIPGVVPAELAKSK